MTCGFMNSAGTDLDSLFLINNSNGGALGFQCSNGQDLGNRFSASSKLNYAVGFQNSAGTDIGYLRGNQGAPAWTRYTASLGHQQSDRGASCSIDHGDSESSYYHTVRYFQGWFNVQGSCTGLGTAGVNWQVCATIWHNEGNYTHRYQHSYVDNSTDFNYAKNKQGIWCPYSNLGYGLAPNTESGWVTLFNAGTGTSCSRNFAYCICGGDGSGGRPWNNHFRVYQRFYNGIGSTNWICHELVIDP